MFWIFSVLLFLLAMLFVAVPLWLRLRPQADAPEDLRKAANIALFHERSDELEADLSAGNIDQAQFDSLLLELQQNLLTDVAESADQPGPVTGSKPPRGKQAKHSPQRKISKLTVALPVLLVLLIPLVAYSLYQAWGYYDDVQVMDLFQATVDNEGDAEETQRLIVSIGQYAQQHPEMPWAFYFLGENFAAIGMFNEAQIAYARAAELLEAGAERALILGRVAMAMYINAEFQLTPDIAEIIEEARALNPGEISVLQLLAIDAEQRQDFRAAIENWRLIIQASPNSQLAQDLRMRISEAQRLLAASGEAPEGPVVQVRVALADELQLEPSLRVFVAARNAEREGLPPLAAVDTTIAQLPATITLDNGSAVGPFNLSSAESVYVSALVSYAGIATPASGDYRIVSEAFDLAEDEVAIELVIKDRIP